MRQLVLLFPAFAALPLSLGAQEVRQQGKALTVPVYTDAQRLNRLAGNFNAFMVAGIAQAKSLGKSAEDFGRFTGDLVASGWGPPQSGTALAFARGMAANFAGFPGGEAEVTATSDSSATVRYRRSYLTYFGPTRVMYGITVEEYERVQAGVVSRIANYLGLRAQLRNEGDWTVVTVNGRGSAAPSSVFPTGTYTGSINAQAVKDYPDLVGSWEVTFMPNGHYAIRKNGAFFIEGDYELSLDQFSIPHADTGTGGVGVKACKTPATYRWVVNAETKALTFGRLADDCQPRINFLTHVTLTKK